MRKLIRFLVAPASSSDVKRRRMKMIPVLTGSGLLAVVIAQAVASGQQLLTRPSPFDDDGTITMLPRATALLQTLAFLPGELALDALGVSDVELTAAGSSNSSSPHQDCSHDRWCSHNDFCFHFKRMLIVDDDLAQCPNAQYQTIQAAVDAATSGDKIKVCPGTYPEQVTVPAGKDNVMLFSNVPWQAVVQMPLLPSDPGTLAIVRVNGAKNTTIRDFTITGPGAGPCNSLRYGVRVDNGGSSTIVGNHITEIRDTPFSGCQNGVGVLVGRSAEMQTASALVVHNVIDKYQKGGVVVDGVMAGGSSWAEVAYNLVDGVGVTGAIAQNGIQISRNAIGYAHHNRTSRNNYLPLDTVSEGILLFDEKPNATVVSKNYSFLNDDGVDLFTSQGTQVSFNLLLKNDFDGIYAGPTSDSNKISYNRAEDNAEHDCHDDSVGTATAGTANFWIKNFGKTENKPGLCKSNPHW